MKDRERFIPVSTLPSLAEFDPGFHRFSWDFTLPPSVDTERIVVDARALQRVQSIAAFSSNHVREYIGDRSEYEVSITGMNSDGTATAGKSKLAKKAETGQSTLHDDIIGEFGVSLMRRYFETRGIHLLNKPEIASRVVDSMRDDGIVREKAWAYELNDALGASVKDAASKHLVQRLPKVGRLVETLALTPAASYIILDIANGKPFPALISATIIGSILVGDVAAMSLINKRNYGDSLISERRWTFNPYGDWQPDRYLATVALSSVSPLIRYRK